MNLTSFFEYQGITFVKDKNGTLYYLQPITETPVSSIIPKQTTLPQPSTKKSSSELKATLKTEENNMDFSRDSDSEKDNTIPNITTGPKKDSSILRIEIFSKLVEIGIPQHYKSFDYLTDAILVVMEPNFSEDDSNSLYRKVAKIHNTTANNIAASIYTLLKQCRETKQYFEIFPESFVASNIEATNFIYQIADYLKMQ